MSALTIVETHDVRKDFTACLGMIGKSVPVPVYRAIQRPLGGHLRGCGHPLQQSGFIIPDNLSLFLGEKITLKRTREFIAKI
jgi:hypothetical protein